MKVALTAAGAAARPPRDADGNLIMIGSGQQHWSTVHVADLAHFFRLVLEDDRARGYYIAGDGRNPTVAELTEGGNCAHARHSRFRRHPCHQEHGEIFRNLVADVENERDVVTDPCGRTGDHSPACCDSGAGIVKRPENSDPAKPRALLLGRAIFVRDGAGFGLRCSRDHFLVAATIRLQ